MRALLSIVFWSFLFTFLSAQEQKDLSPLLLSSYLDELVVDDFKPIGNGEVLRVDRVPIQNVPIIQTNPDADKVFFLDFDGHWLKDPFWLIVSDNSELDSIELKATTCTQEEVYKIVEIVEEDFIMLDINVTTSEAVFLSVTPESRQRLVITPSVDWQEFANGGVARLNSFGRGDSPCFTFYHVVQAIHIAETCSHELGHALGLTHDGRSEPLEAYYRGDTDFGVIMGLGYHNEVSHWSKGEYLNADNLQDDYEVMTQELHGIQIRADDFSDADSSAFVLDNEGNIFVEAMITTPEDVDWFSFSSEGGLLKLVLSQIDEKRNLVAELVLYDEDMMEVSRYNSWKLNQISLKEQIDPGVYYVSIDGVGVGNPHDGGFTDYGSLGRYSLSGGVAKSSLLSFDVHNSDLGIFHPNPSDGRLNYTFHKKDTGDVSLQVFNEFGGQVFEQLHFLSNTYSLDLDLSGLSSGVYFTKVLYDDEVYHGRIVISD